MFYPIKLLADWLIYDIFQISTDSQLGTSINFFVYDSVKILILLLIINYFMAIVRHYLPIEKLKDFLASRQWYGADYFLGSFFGTITPFCSCSSIPLFIGFLEAGIPLGVTMSFLITSLLVNQVAVVLFAGLFGWKITILYVISAVLLGVVGGFIIGKLKLEKYVADYVWQIKSKKIDIKQKKETWKSLVKIFWKRVYRLAQLWLL